MFFYGEEKWSVLGTREGFSGFVRLTMIWSRKRMILHFKVQGGGHWSSATYLEF